MNLEARIWDSHKEVMLYDVHFEMTIWNGLVVMEADDVFLIGTGLKDVKGVKIYEGDLADITFRSAEKGGYTERGIVEWDQKCAKFKFKCNDLLFVNALENPVDYKIEVVGNVYEHPKAVR